MKIFHKNTVVLENNCFWPNQLILLAMFCVEFSYMELFWPIFILVAT